MNRRNFIQKSLTSAALLSVNAFPLSAVESGDLQQLTILHTNDWHSRIDPFPMDGGRDQGLGGIAQRAKMIQKVRAEVKEVLLLDSGDIFQGTPYFNLYYGEPEMKLMSALNYDAATIGNHDFDGGMDGLYKVLPHANFPLISSNYDFSDTILHSSVLKYKTFQKGKIKVGVFGIGIELEGLVAKDLYKQTKYLEPVSIANRTATFLKKEEQCDLVICLSHLGYNYDDGICDVRLAKLTKDIDLILGGHSHTYMKEPDRRKNSEGEEVLINQTGWGGMHLGRIDVFFEKKRNRIFGKGSNDRIE
ncbi:MAG: bifunctional UDP-sugar hydrolase/5'-nucleotidase [Saprospiraceae bacterium]